MIRIAEIEVGSIAEELHLEIGSKIVRINGERVRDGIDFTFLQASDRLELETVTPGGEPVVFDIDQLPGERLGIVPVPDTVRECANECVFCFIDGNPEGARASLSLRDDDFRLSFTYGNYVTLTNLGPRGLRRLVDQRISPLYVSVHATEADVRIRLLKNQRAGLIVDQLEYLTGNGLEVHTQVVLCPGWNDGDHLDRTIDDLFGIGEGVRTLSIVPVGLTKYNIGRPVLPLSPSQGAKALEQVARARRRARAERGRGWCYAADELHLIAGRPLPPLEYYDDWELTENGVGAVARFIADFEAGMRDLPELSGRRIRIVTGHSMAPFLRERSQRLAAATSAEVRVLAVTNTFFGDSVTVAGLLGGRDVLAHLGDSTERDLILIPAQALNGDDLFIDGVSLEDFRARVAPSRVRSGYDVTEAIRSP